MRQLRAQPVWIGNAGDGRDFRAIHAHGIRAIVQVAYEEPCLEAPRDLILSRIPLMDGSENDPALTRLAIGSLVALIRARVPTLVACSNGLSRSPCIVAAAFSLVEGRALGTILEETIGTSPADISPQFWNHVREVSAAMAPLRPNPLGESP